MIIWRTFSQSADAHCIPIPTPCWHPYGVYVKPQPSTLSPPRRIIRVISRGQETQPTHYSIVYPIQPRSGKQDAIVRKHISQEVKAKNHPTYFLAAPFLPARDLNLITRIQHLLNRRKFLLDTPRTYKARKNAHAPRLVVCPRRARTTKGLLADHGACALCVCHFVSTLRCRDEVETH
jgi:hypothetical protein